MNIKMLIALTVFLGFNSALGLSQATVSQLRLQSAIAQRIAAPAERKQWRFKSGFHTEK